MRLLEVNSDGGFSLIEGDELENEKRPYAILSHTWEKDEVTFDDLIKGNGPHKEGYKKISYCAKQALRDGIKYIWVDTCCIKKSDNTITVELQYAIDSMFRWYKNAVTCYVYLSNVPDSTSGLDANDQSWQHSFEPSFRKSRWFTRGWTLQELIAPASVEFFSKTWEKLGSKQSLERQISEVTKIPVEALRGSPLDGFSVTERISWSEGRCAKYEEDNVYSLFGIFGVSMPLNYGERKDSAFRRLHDEIQRIQKGHASLDFSVGFSLVGIAEANQFVAREKELAEMHGILHGDGSRRIAVLHGLGGIGKTQLTVAYAKRYKHTYSAVFWLTVEDEDSLKQSFTKVANQILQEHPSAPFLSTVDLKGNLDAITRAVKSWFSLRNNTQWLLVYDNYDNPKVPGNTDPAAVDVRRYFPEGYQGSIIITTRSSEVTVGHRINIKKLIDVRDSLQILANSSRREILDDDTDALNLATELDGLPLALASAGAYLDQVPATSFSTYLRLYKASWLKLQKGSRGLSSYENKMLYSTWQMTFEHVEKQNKLAGKLLQLWAYFDSQDIWFELLQHSDSGSPEWFRELTEDEFSFNGAIGVLCNYGLVEADSSQQDSFESRGYNMHVCVHAWTMSVLNQEWNDELATMALKCVGSHVPEQSTARPWVTQRRLLRHASRSSHQVEKGRIHYPEMGRDFHVLGFLYLQLDKLQEAEKMYERALWEFENSEGPDHLRTLVAVNSLALVYRRQGRLKEAEKMLDRALRGMEKATGPNAEETLNVIKHLGSLYITLGRPEDAEKMLQKALRGYEKSFGPDFRSTFNTMNILGILYDQQGRLEEAEKMHGQALRGYQKLVGEDHIWTLETNRCLGLLYTKQGRLENAEKMLRRALRGYETVLWGPDNEQTLMLVIDLGILYMNQGRQEEAEKMLERALRGLEKALGPNHRWTKKSANSLLDFYHNRCFDAIKPSTLHNSVSRPLSASSVNPFTDYAKAVDICIQYPSYRASGLAKLCAMFRWNGQDDFSTQAFHYSVYDSLLSYYSQCDGCGHSLDIDTGRYACKSCKDVDLCESCYEKYQLDELRDKMVDCQDHVFLQLAKAGSLERLDSQIPVEEWLQNLKVSLLGLESASSTQGRTESSS